GSGYFLATYGSFVVNATTDRYFYAPGAKATVSVEARNYDSQPIRTPMQVELLRWDPRGRKYDVVSKAAATTGADGKGQAEVAVPRNGGSYRVRVSAPSEGREVEDYSYFWVSGAASDTTFDDPRRSVEIVTDKKTYRPGETAHILIAA